MSKGLEYTLNERKERISKIQETLLPILENQTEFTLEIGCGHGHFLNAYAAENPQKLCIGIDLLNKRILKSEKKKDLKDLPNAHFLKAEATEFLEALPASVNIAETFLLYPDPWPKAKHHRRRLIQAEFLNNLADKSTPKAPFYFRSDHEDYSEWVKEHLAEHPRWQILTDSQELPLEVTTFFQEQMGTYATVIAQKVD